jgi:hypothetical protein
MWPTLHSFAALVQRLRTVQKATGSGYRTPEAGAAAKGLEAQVDAEITRIQKFPMEPDETPPAGPSVP